MFFAVFIHCRFPEGFDVEFSFADIEDKDNSRAGNNLQTTG